MKAEIEKIIEKHYDPDTEVLESGKIAEEIESYVFEFTKWLHDNCYKHLHLWGIVDDDSGIYYGNKELYNYWFKNIKSSIPMLPVKSSQIKSVGWRDNTLYIEFLKGTVYPYKDVPEDIFNLLCLAKRVGKYFASEIKGKYEFTKTDKKVIDNELK